MTSRYRRLVSIAALLTVASLSTPRAQSGTQLTVSSSVVVPGESISVTITAPAGQTYALVGSSIKSGLSHAGVALGLGVDYRIFVTATMPAAGQVVISIVPPFAGTTLDRYYLQVVTSSSPSFASISVSNGVVLQNADLVSGLRGPAGPAGATGDQGPTGAIGPSLQGPAGNPGPTGPIGPTGATGAVGAVGAVGPTGLTGLIGPPGDTGPQGASGAIGPTGAEGPIGDQGPAGPQGPDGDTGATGAKGVTGLTGTPGEYGGTRYGHWSTAVDVVGNVGQGSSIAIGSDGLPFVSYYDVTNADLKVAHCNDPACTTATITTVDAEGDVGARTSVAIGVDGLPIIAYSRQDQPAILLARCSNVVCSSSTRVASISGGTFSGAAFPSIAIGLDGNPMVSFESDRGLRLARCVPGGCLIDLVDQDVAGTTGRYSSLAIGSDGLPVISYQFEQDGDLRVAHCPDVNCSFNATITTLDTNGTVGVGTSIAIGADGLPIIAYRNGSTGNLKVAHCSNVVCDEAVITALDTVGDTGRNPSVAIPPDGYPLISYGDETNDDLRVARCLNFECTAAVLTTADAAGLRGGHSSITIGQDGFALISHYDYGNGNLRVLHCSNKFCTPYVRGR